MGILMPIVGFDNNFGFNSDRPMMLNNDIGDVLIRILLDLVSTGGLK
jgi:hypothetical protein